MLGKLKRHKSKVLHHVRNHEATKHCILTWSARIDAPTAVAAVFPNLPKTNPEAYPVAPPTVNCLAEDDFCKSSKWSLIHSKAVPGSSFFLSIDKTFSTWFLTPKERNRLNYSHVYRVNNTNLEQKAWIRCSCQSNKRRAQQNNKKVSEEVSWR